LIRVANGQFLQVTTGRMRISIKRSRMNLKQRNPLPEFAFDQTENR